MVGLGLFYCNCRSLLPKIDELRVLAVDSRPDVIALVETWLDQDIRESEVAIPGYGLYRRDRSRRGGGLALYVSECLCVKNLFSCADLELLSVVLSLESGSVLIALHYRPPSSPRDLEELELVLHQLSLHTYQSSLLVGDFNIDLLRASDPLAVDLAGRASALGLQQVVRDPTRLSPSCNSLIDHLYSTNPAAIRSIAVGSPLGTSDHCSLRAILDLSPPRRPPFVKRKIWLYSRANFEGLNEDLFARLDSFGAGCSDADTLCRRFQEIFLSSVQKFIPSKLARCRKSPPWLSRLALRKMKARDLAHKIAIRLNTPAAWSAFRTCRNRVVSALRESKRQFLACMSGQLKSIKDFWKSFYSISKVAKRVPAVVSRGDSSAATAVGKAALLNEHFVSCFSPPSPLPAPPVKGSHPTCLDDLAVTGSDVSILIGRMRTKVASGPDAISSRMLKGCAQSISGPLSVLFNTSLSTGRVPTAWKSSVIVPIHKDGDPSLVSNYRPISLLSLSSKLLERLVHEALLVHVLEHGYLSPNQFGFRPGSSTTEAILAATRDWHESLESSASVACVFLDLSKAFDSLPHCLVLSSLGQVGVCGSLYNWFQSYLTGRRQRVVLDGASSSLQEVSSGVPQGSILGPLLFLLSVNSVFSVSLSYNAIIALYADDILLHKEIRCDLDLVAFQSDVSLVVEWVHSVGLRLNSSKSKSLLISRKRQPPPLAIEVDGVPIEPVHSFRYLGVIISEDLRWNLHIDAVCSKARRLLGFLYRCFRGGDSGSLSYLYKSLVLPVLGYCSPVWDPQQKGLSLQLERVQGFAARLATGRWDADRQLLFTELGWCQLVQRRKLDKIRLCRRILLGRSIIPPSVFTPLEYRRSLRLCVHPRQLYLPFVRTSYHQHSFFIDTIKLWNFLPATLVELDSDLAFKRHLKKFLSIS